MSNAAAAKPAFVGVEHNRRLPLLRIGNHYIGPAHFNAFQAAGTEFGIK